MGDDKGNAGGVGSKTSQGMMGWNNFLDFLTCLHMDKHGVTVVLTFPQNSYVKIQKTVYKVEANRETNLLFCRLFRKEADINGNFRWSSEALLSDAKNQFLVE